MSKPPVMNLNALSGRIEVAHGDRFACRLIDVARPQGATKLGCNVTIVPPGKRAFPYPFHHANEELFVIRSGHGTLRRPGGEQAIGPGDLSCSVAGAEGAHQPIDTETEDLRDLAVSSRFDPEIAEYPDGQQYAAIAGRLPGQPRHLAQFGVVAMKGASVDCWEGE
jgi:uncharacterized cupin superfamily protein